jgi:hypothetical protein
MKETSAEYQRRWRKDNKEKSLSYARNFRERHKEKIKENRRLRGMLAEKGVRL